MDASQRFYAAYNGVIAGLLEHPIGIYVLEPLEGQSIIEQVAQKTVSMYPLGSPVISSLRSVIGSEGLRRAKPMKENGGPFCLALAR